MRKHLWAVCLVLGMVGAIAVAQEVFFQAGPGSVSYANMAQSGGSQPAELTVEQQRKLGLSDEQIQKIAEKRRDLEKERAKLETQVKTARDAAAAANAEVARLNGEVQSILTLRLTKVYESVMSEAQVKAWRQQRFADQARQWLQGYKNWMKLTDAQMDDIANLLVPVFEKYARMDDERAAARERLADLRRADKIDVAAIDKAEKDLAELSKPNVYQLRQEELMDKMRAGLMPDQLEKLDRIHRPK